MNISHQTIIGYLQNLVDQHTDIRIEDFYRMDISEILGAMKTSIQYPCFALESHEGNFDSSSAMNSLENKIFAFSILKKPEYGNFEDQNTALDDCELIGKQFLARMRYDSAQETSLLHKLFSLGNVNYHKVGPLYTDHLYGYRFEISLLPDKTSMKVTPENWTDIDEVC